MFDSQGSVPFTIKMTLRDREPRNGPRVRFAFQVAMANDVALPLREISQRPLDRLPNPHSGVSGRGVPLELPTDQRVLT